MINKTNNLYEEAIESCETVINDILPSYSLFYQKYFFEMRERVIGYLAYLLDKFEGKREDMCETILLNPWILHDFFIFFYKKHEEICEDWQFADVTLFFDKDVYYFYSNVISKVENLLYVEFVDVDATIEKKEITIKCLPGNVEKIKEELGVIYSYAYVITEFDIEFERFLLSNDFKSMTELNNDSELAQLNAYKKYNKDLNVMLYVMDIKTVLTYAIKKDKILQEKIKEMDDLDINEVR